MILVAFLLGGAFWWGLYQWLGQPAVVFLGLFVLVLVIIGAVSDVWREVHASRTATRRWRAWVDNDAERQALRDQAALRRILRGHR